MNPGHMVVGDSVPELEQLSTQDVLKTSSSMQNIPAVDNKVNTTVSTVSNDERQRWEAEKNNLYMQLDDKVRGRRGCGSHDRKFTNFKDFCFIFPQFFHTGTFVLGCNDMFWYFVVRRSLNKTVV